jgi:hypothetical protein
MHEIGTACKISIRKSEEKRPLGETYSVRWIEFIWHRTETNGSLL